MRSRPGQATAPSLSERLRRIEEVLGVSLDSEQSGTSLYAAVLALAVL